MIVRIVKVNGKLSSYIMNSGTFIREVVILTEGRALFELHIQERILTFKFKISQKVSEVGRV